MIEFSNIEVSNFKNAIRGMRNPKDSWDKSDSTECIKRTNCENCELKKNMGCFTHKYFANNAIYSIGPNDMKLAKALVSAGSDHRKFMRQIIVSVDILAPLYLWKEFDTYKVGTVANSCSTMHRIHSKPFSIDQFSHEHMVPASKMALESKILPCLEWCRKMFIDTKDMQYWYSIIQLLPSSYNQMRTCSMNYEVLRNMYHARKNHKLEEWKVLCEWIETLPYSELITCHQR